MKKFPTERTRLATELNNKLNKKAHKT